MTLSERALAELAAGPRTALALARTLLPHRPEGPAVNQMGTVLRRLKARGLARVARALPRRGRGQARLEWERVASKGAPSVGCAGDAGGGAATAGTSEACGLAPGAARGRVEVPARAAECLLPEGAWVEVAPALDPETGPEAIAAAQRAEVSAALPAAAEDTRADWDAAGCAPTDEQLAESVAGCVSGRVDLPVWTVARRMSELRGETPAAPVAERVDDPEKNRRGGLGGGRVRRKHKAGKEGCAA